MVANTADRRRVVTNIDGTLKSSIALCRSIREFAQSPENTSLVPGWHVIRPSASDLKDLREVQVLEAQPGGEEFQYLLPRDANTTVAVEVGQLEVFANGVSLGYLEPNQSPYFNPAGSVCGVRALSYPTSVLLVSYRDRDRGPEDCV